MPGTQIGVHRTSDRTIQIFGQQSVLKQAADGHPIGLDVIATWEGTDNMRGAAVLDDRRARRRARSAASWRCTRADCSS
jgi:hypothetical protein